MSDQDPDDEQWSDHTRQRFRAAAAALEDAVRQHSQALLAMTGRQAEIPAIFQSGHQLALATTAYAEAQFDYTGTFPPVRVPGDPDVADDECAEEDDEEPAVARVSVLHRADYRVSDAVAVLQAGRRAYLEVWPDDTEDDAASDVSHLGRALYQLQHAGGLAALDETPGLEPAGAATWVVEATEVLADRDPDDWPDDPFALGEDAEERVLHRLGVVN